MRRELYLVYYVRLCIFRFVAAIFNPEFMITRRNGGL